MEKQNICHIPHEWTTIINRKPLRFIFMEAVMLFICIFSVLSYIDFCNNFSIYSIFRYTIIIIVMLLLLIINLKISNMALNIFAKIIIIALSTLISGLLTIKILLVLFLIVYSNCFIKNEKSKYRNTIKVVRNGSKLKTIHIVKFSGKSGETKVENRIMFFEKYYFIIGEFIIFAFYKNAVTNSYHSLIYIYAALIMLLAVIFIIYFHNVKTYALTKWENIENENTLRKIKNISIMAGIIMSVLIALFGGLIFALFYNSKLMKLTIKIPLNEKLNNQIQAKNSHNARLNLFKSGISNKTSKYLISLQWIIKIIIIAGTIFTLVCIIYGIIIAFKKLTRSTFYKLVSSEDEIRETIEEDKKCKKHKRFKNILKNIKLKTNLSNNEKIRQVYLKLINSYRKHGITVKAYNTPCEIKSQIYCNTKEKLNIVTDVYEIARYSGKSCSEADVEKIKNAIGLKK